jgi:hypothetical protein
LVRQQLGQPEETARPGGVDVRPAPVHDARRIADLYGVTPLLVPDVDVGGEYRQPLADAATVTADPPEPAAF